MQLLSVCLLVRTSINPVIGFEGMSGDYRGRQGRGIGETDRGARKGKEEGLGQVSQWERLERRGDKPLPHVWGRGALSPAGPPSLHLLILLDDMNVLSSGSYTLLLAFRTRFKTPFHPEDSPDYTPVTALSITPPSLSYHSLS